MAAAGDPDRARHARPAARADHLPGSGDTMRTRSERQFTADDYVLFATYRPRRALVEPPECNHDPEHC